MCTKTCKTLLSRAALDWDMDLDLDVDLDVHLDFEIIGKCKTVIEFAESKWTWT